MKAQPPKHLTPEAKRVFRELAVEYNIVDAGGLKILTAGVEAWDRARKAMEQIGKEGMTTQDRWGQVKVHPLCSVERDARAAWLQALKLLNLDISGGGKDEKEKDLK